MRAILTYHSIDSSGSPISCHPDAFTRHMAWLTSGRVQVKTIEDLLQTPASADAVALTFDDGFENFGAVAAPRLIERGLPVTVFVVPALAGTTNSWDDRPRRVTPHLPLLDWPALLQLQERGVTLGAHGLTHRDLTQLDPRVLEEEVRGCADRVEARAGQRPTVFAYPYGHRNAAATRAVAQHFSWACTTRFQLLDASSARWALPRLDMYYFQRPGSLEAWGTRWFETRIAMRRGGRRIRALASGHSSGSSRG